MKAETLSRRELLQRMRDSEYRYNNLFNAMPACFWEVDFAPVGSLLMRLGSLALSDLGDWLADERNIENLMGACRVVDCNQRAVDLFGRNDKTELLTSIAPFWPKESYPAFAGSIAAFLSGEPSFTTETRFLTIGGECLDVLFTVCFPPDRTQGPRMLIGLVDLTEANRTLDALRQANIRAETLAEAQAFSFWQLDTHATNRMMADLRRQGITDLAAYMESHPEFIEEALDATIVTDVNQKSLELYGMKDKSEAVGKGIRNYWLPGRYEAFKGSLAAGFNGISQFQKVTQTRTVDGRILDCRFWMAAPQEMRANGTVMVAIQDLTEENAARKERDHLREGLAHAGRVLMLGEFTASIAHEINQPLAAVRAAASAAQRWLALDPPNLEQAAAALASIGQSAQRAGQIIDRIRGMAVKRQPQCSLVNVAELVHETVAFLSPEFRSMGAMPMVSIDCDIPELWVDRTQIQQVLVNLIVNALQAMEQARSPCRQVEISVSSDADGKVGFRVRDHGPGVDPEAIKRLFEHFFTTKDGGMGIGLTICQSIVQAHGGKIAVCNMPEGGAQFSFVLSAIRPEGDI